MFYLRLLPVYPILSPLEQMRPWYRQWDPEGVGRNLFDSFGVLGLGLDATEMDVKTSYRMLALRNHPDKNNPERTGMTRDQATAHFQLLNLANSYLRSVL